MNYTILYYIKYHNIASFADTPVLIKLFMLGPVNKSLIVDGDIAIIGSSSMGQGEI